MRFFVIYNGKFNIFRFWKKQNKLTEDITMGVEKGHFFHYFTTFYLKYLNVQKEHHTASAQFNVIQQGAALAN